MFWKEVKRVRKGEHSRDEMVKDVSGPNIVLWCRVEEEMGRVF